jgi:hypothetical protein
MRNVASRKTFLQAAAGISALLVALPKPAKADDGKVPPSAVQYQDKPNGDKRCSKCASFVPGKPGEDGTCKIVSGNVSPNGYCIAFSAA